MTCLPFILTHIAEMVDNDLGTKTPQPVVNRMSTAWPASSGVPMFYRGYDTSPQLFAITVAAKAPGPQVMPPPGWLPLPHRYKPLIGV